MLFFPVLQNCSIILTVSGGKNLLERVQLWNFRPPGLNHHSWLIKIFIFILDSSEHSCYPIHFDPIWIVRASVCFGCIFNVPVMFVVHLWHVYLYIKLSQSQQILLFLTNILIPLKIVQTQYLIWCSLSSSNIYPDISVLTKIKEGLMTQFISLGLNP